MLEYSPEVRKWFPMLAETAGIVGSVQIRSTATVMGNVCNALPSAEMGPPLIALNAEVALTGTSGSRTMALEQFFTGPRQTARRQDEIATEIHVPNVPANTGMIYVRHSPRRAMDLAVVGVAAVVTTDASHDVLQDVRIALGAVAPTPLRARRAEAIVQGQRYSEEILRRAGETAGEESKPISDIRASEEYRREMVRVLTRRMLHWARERSRLTPGEVKILRYPTSMHFIYTPAA
jgi:carbon-monoxide dehydrogenase medium subunit